jgi:hydrophobic/amphiphilic exporter-1 (mainly G- bacteria), HAE1 family
VRGHYDDVYCQIALLMLVGLAAKNAIPIVDFTTPLGEVVPTVYYQVLERAREVRILYFRHSRRRPLP